MVAREIGVVAALLGRWVAIERAHDDDPPAALDLDERAELAAIGRGGRVADGSGVAENVLMAALAAAVVAG